jgi:hypothetical protein
MKTGNFPEKKNQRRIRALGRLILNSIDAEAAPYEMRVLRERIVDSARDVHTKKIRSAR